MVVEAVQAAPAGAAADVIAINMVPDEPVLRQVAGDVRVPVRLFFGDADAMAGPEHGRWWQQVIPDAELTIVPGAGHLVVLAAWEQILDAVKQG